MFVAFIQYDLDTSIIHRIGVYVETLYEAEIYVKRLISMGFQTEDVDLVYVDDMMYQVYVDFQYVGTIDIVMKE